MLIISFKSENIGLNSYKLPNVYNAVFNKEFNDHHHALDDAKLLLKL